ncbi:MAG: fibronectin type III domain-containing protein [Ruminococcus sp.]|nr:fibronectin type III domain-containing protein [Ruminococcus sp.]
MRKHILKKTTALLMALTVCSVPQTFSATAVLSNDVNTSLADNEDVFSYSNIIKLNTDSAVDTVKENTGIAESDATEKDTESDNQGVISEDSADVTETENAGRIHVSLGSALNLNNSIDFTVTLTSDSGYSHSEIVSLEKSDESKVSFDNLEDGEYTLTVDAMGFAVYSQNITVEKKMYSLNLTAGFCEGYTYDKDGLHPGVIMIGDADSDGDVDDDDKNIIVDTIDGTNTSKDYETDLNHDGTTDLVDLSLFSISYHEDRDIMAKIEEFISPAVIVPSVSEDTEVSGDVEKMLNGEETVTLTPSGGDEISKENPVSMGFDLMSDGNATVVDGITFETGSENPVSEAFIDVAYIEDGVEYTITVPVKSGVDFLLKEDKVYATLDENGNINVHLGSSVAVKKVTFTITGMQNNNNLAEISKVEFVNGMESRIPEPQMDMPMNLTATAESEKFRLSWEPCMNVTGYEIKIEQGGKTVTYMSVSNAFTATSFNENDIKNYTTYKVSVQSVNGTWKSGYCDSVEVTPKPNKRPDKPDGVKASGIYKGINVSWQNMDDTQSYNLFYKLRDSDDEYTEISGITTNKYTISELETLSEYEVYVIGVNELGESPASIHTFAKTTDLNPAEMPKYNLINRDEDGNPGSTHIVSVTRNGGEMVDSELDKDSTNTAWGAVDGNAASYYKKDTWDDGGFNNLGGNGLIYTFDKEYTMDTICILTTTSIDYTNLIWWDSDGNQVGIINDAYANISSRKTDSEGRYYYVLKFSSPITASKIQIGLARYLASPINISETYFYYYDELMDEVMALYEDDLHTVLREDVTQETIDTLREKVNTPDEFGEANPNTDALMRELETAEKILNAKSISSPVEIHKGITTKDTGRGFSGLNAWQPLGVSIGTGEEVTIYVGSDKKKTGDSTDLRLIVTQYHSEAGGVTLDGANLKVGANTFRLSKGSIAGAESGGALYIQYQGASNANERYSVRVTGGSEVPVLDLYNVTDEEERKERTVEYINELDEYVPNIEALHNQTHKGSGNNNIDYDYDSKNCILGASDILLDTMMISLPAQQILAGAGKGTAEERAETVLDSMQSMEDMMYLFYQHKGLNETAPTELNQVPKGHLNIRYQRMFSGAFMYASGNHIGIEWDSSPAIMQSPSVQTDEDGRYISGSYFGWGIAHEIGHCINQGTYAVAEITNNYFSQLAQAQDKNAGMRFDYSNIYSKVTSGTKGNSSNVATQLGMYWQLHLAYDKGLNYKTYSDYTEQLDNIFYARVDTYSRNTESAPAPDGIKLTLGSNTDQNLMRLACAAAERNVLEFFERWGKTPDKDTIAYAEQFEKETRAIFYANDDSRIYALEGKGSVLDSEGSVSAIKDVSVNIGKSANKVELKFNPTDIPESDILGYEVVRCTISGGKTEETPVGFATGSSFTDTVTTLNNRAVFYKVTLIDRYLNRSAVFTTDMVKIEHDGSMDKTNWTISTNGLTAESVVNDATDEMPCEQTVDNPAEQAVDNDLNTVYAPHVDSENAEIIIDFNRTLVTTGMKYTAGEGSSVGAYEVYVLSDDEWILTAEGTFKGSETVYFANDDNKYISTYSASAVKLVLLNQKDTTVSIAELDILGVTGDNVNFRKAEDDTTAVIGTLGADYKYGENSGDVIPKDSVVFTGSYKGNPAYNVVILYDDKGNIVGGMDSENNLKAQQIILANVPDGENIADVSDGTWIYWIEPEQMKDINLPETVRVELYRVNNALTNEGQRLVSDSLFEEVPSSLPSITFEK